MDPFYPFPLSSTASDNEFAIPSGPLIQPPNLQISSVSRDEELWKYRIVSKVEEAPKIKYRFSTIKSKRPAPLVKLVKDGMTEWAEYANVIFEDFTDKTGSAIDIIFEGGPSTTKDSNGKCKTVNLGPGFTSRNVLHELGHVLGLEHEHQRPDRDLASHNYNLGGRPIVIKKDGTRTRMDDDTWNDSYYTKHYQVTTFSRLFDERSIMMYPIGTKNGRGVTSSDNDKLSRLDKAFIMLVYPGKGGPDMKFLHDEVELDAFTVAQVSNEAKESIQRLIRAKKFSDARKEFFKSNEALLPENLRKSARKPPSTGSSSSKRRGDFNAEGATETSVDDHDQNISQELECVVVIDERLVQDEELGE